MQQRWVSDTIMCNSMTCEIALFLILWSWKLLCSFMFCFGLCEFLFLPLFFSSLIIKNTSRFEFIISSSSSSFFLSLTLSLPLPLFLSLSLSLFLFSVQGRISKAVNQAVGHLWGEREGDRRNSKASIVDNEQFTYWYIKSMRVSYIPSLSLYFFYSLPLSLSASLTFSSPFSPSLSSLFDLSPFSPLFLFSSFFLS